MTHPRSVVRRALFPVLTTALTVSLTTALATSTLGVPASQAAAPSTASSTTMAASTLASDVPAPRAVYRRTFDARGPRHAVRARLRSPGGRVPARLVVREVEPATGKVLDVRRSKVLVRRSWSQAEVRVTRRSSTSVMRVEVRTRQARKGRVLLDRVRVVRLSKGKRPGEKPTDNPKENPKEKPKGKPVPPPEPPRPPRAPQDVAGYLSNGCSYSSRGIPACGAYLGSAYGANTEPAPMEAATGHRLGVRRTYYQGHQVDKAVSVSRADLAAGRLPWISFKLPLSWEQMAAGAGDAWVQDLANKLKTLNGPVWVAFHHEPEKDGDIQAWRAMQERLGPIVRSTAPNAAFTVITTGWNQLYGPAEFRLENIWPRTKVDVAGFDVYNWHMTKRSDGTMVTKTEDTRSVYFDRFESWARANDTTWALAETGLTDEAFAQDGTWLQRTYDQLVATGGLAMAYFNTELNSYGNSYPITGPAKLASFAAAQSKAPLLPPR